MNFLLKVYSVQDVVDGPDVAFVIINEKERQLLLRRRAMLSALRAYDPELTVLEFNAQMDWLRDPDGELVEQVDHEQVVRCVRPSSKFEEARVECIVLRLDDSGVNWECLLKHTDVRLNTALIAWKLLEES